MTPWKRFALAAFGAILPSLADLLFRKWQIITLNPTVAAIMGQLIFMAIIGVAGGLYVAECYKKINEPSAIIQLGIAFPSLLMMFLTTASNPSANVTSDLPRAAFAAETRNQQFVRGFLGRVPPPILEANLPRKILLPDEER